MDNQAVNKILKEAKELWPRTLPFPNQEKFRRFIFLVLGAANRAGYAFLDQNDLKQVIQGITEGIKDIFEEEQKPEEYARVCHNCKRLMGPNETKCRLCGNPNLSSSVKLTGTRCVVCNGKQFYTPSGICCAKGHGGTEPKERREGP